MVQFLDLHKINARFEASFKASFETFLKSGRYILGDAVQQFESEFASYCGVSNCIGVANGLDALRLIFEGYKVQGRLQNGDEVLMAANSYIATVLAIKQAGLKPVFIDAEDKLYNLDLNALQDYSVKGAKALLITHLYGQIAPMDAVKAYVKENDLLVVEDAAQAHGAYLRGKRAGALGDAAAFSFYPTKNLGALGDGGAVTTNDKGLAEIISKLRNYGKSSKYINDYPGINSRLDEVQAGFLSIKLKVLDADNEIRRTIALRYISEIKNEKITLPFYDGSKSHVFHVFVVLIKDRPAFLNHLDKHHIGSLIHYPIPAFRQDALPKFNKLSFPVTETISNQVVSIPISPVMTQSEVDDVINCLNLY
tara:strand:- start:370 stop:1467 length:1098 start_codon:yes stop_codon:yes gene_type:complete